MSSDLKAIGIGIVLGFIAWIGISMSTREISATPIINSIEASIAGPNDSQTVTVTFIAPNTSDSIVQIAVAIWQNGFLKRYAVFKPLPNDTIVSSLRMSPPVPGHTASYVLGIITTLHPLRPVRMRAFYWERTNNSVAMVTEPQIKPRISMRWSNPVTAGVLGDSFRVWRRQYLFPNDTLGSALSYQGTLFPGDTTFILRDSLRIGTMYKFYGSVYLFGAERIRYPFFSVVVR